MENELVQKLPIGLIFILREKRILREEGRRFKPIERGWNVGKFFKDFSQEGKPKT